MDNVVKLFLNEHGYDNCIDKNQETRVNNWLEAFKGPTKKYNIQIYNGKTFTPHKIKSLNLENQICADLADFFFNEKLEITIDDDEIQQQINQCLQQNNFLHNANKLMQLVKALGTGAFVPFLDQKNFRVLILFRHHLLVLNNTQHRLDQKLGLDMSIYLTYTF